MEKKDETLQETEQRELLLPAVIEEKKNRDLWTTLKTIRQKFVRQKPISEEYQIPEEQAAAVLHRFDHRRSNFYHANTGLNWREREGYHMVLDSGLLGVDLCAKLLVTASQSKE